MDDQLLIVAHRVLFITTLLVELAALVVALRVRARFEAADLGRLTWSLFSAFLAVRLVAELRLATLYFDLVPGLVIEGTAWRTFYVVVLRYLYTASDLLAIAGLVVNIRALRGLGLHFSLQRFDRVAMLVLASLPVVAFWLREQLEGSTNVVKDDSILAYRLVAVTVAAIIAMLCIAILRYVLQMGGGALARLWGAVVVAELARAESFVVLAVFALWSAPLGDLVEQAFLLVFAAAWWKAGVEQRKLTAP